VTYGGDPGTEYLGGEIFINAWYGTVAWGQICGPEDDTDPSATGFICEVTIPAGMLVNLQVDMAVAGAPDGRIYMGDMSDSPWGGHGQPLATLFEVYVNDVLVAYVMADGTVVGGVFVDNGIDPYPETQNFEFTVPAP
jgi:hypothetical protein